MLWPLAGRTGYTSEMTERDEKFLADFFRKVGDAPLPSYDERYVEIYENPALAEHDPVDLLARAITWTPESVQLLSGYRGTGKSTELRRLQKRLQEDDYLVFLYDVEEWLNLSAPVDVSDFLMAVAGMFAESANMLLGSDTHDYWQRLVEFLRQTRVEVKGIDISAGMIKVALKSDPTFSRKLRERMAGHLGALARDVHRFLDDCMKSLRNKYGSGREIVLLLDSVEHFRGTSVNAEEVHRSVENLFASHSDKLKLPRLHVVYTVPPYLRVLHPNLGALYQPGGLKILPAVRLQRQDGERIDASFDVMEQIVRKRGDWEKLLGKRSELIRLIECSGGHLRDLMRLVAEVLLRATTLPVPESTVNSAIEQLRGEYLPISNEDARWLAEIARSHDIALRDLKALPGLTRLLDTHLVLCYRNGGEWYDVHPLISERVQEQAKQR